MIYIRLAISAIRAGFTLMGFGLLVAVAVVMGVLVGITARLFTLPTRLIEWGRRWSQS